MTLTAIIEKCEQLNILEERSSSDDYKELVFSHSDLQSWSKMLEEVLGPPVKPVGEEPTEEDVKSTKEYGGIYENQTLFKAELNGRIIIAMLWPWSDDAHITLKLAILD